MFRKKLKCLKVTRIQILGPVYTWSFHILQKKLYCVLNKNKSWPFFQSLLLDWQYFRLKKFPDFVKTVNISGLNVYVIYLINNVLHKTILWIKTGGPFWYTVSKSLNILNFKVFFHNFYWSEQWWYTKS